MLRGVATARPTTSSGGGSNHRRGPGPMSPRDGDLYGVHVLVVEDTDDSRELLRMVLEYCGALVTTAESAERAKQLLDTLRPHVLVTDISMPDDGIALIREVRTVAQ